MSSKGPRGVVRGRRRGWSRLGRGGRVLVSMTFLLALALDGLGKRGKDEGERTKGHDASQGSANQPPQLERWVRSLSLSALSSSLISLTKPLSLLSFDHHADFPNVIDSKRRRSGSIAPPIFGRVQARAQPSFPSRPSFSFVPSPLPTTCHHLNPDLLLSFLFLPCLSRSSRFVLTRPRRFSFLSSDLN